MLIDNKTTHKNNQDKTLYEFFKRNLQSGNFDVVSGYFSVSMLALP